MKRKNLYIIFVLSLIVISTIGIGSYEEMNKETSKDIQTLNLNEDDAFVSHMSILQLRQAGGWRPQARTWEDARDLGSLYIDPSWFSSPTWRVYLRASAGTCCWSCGLFCTTCDVRKLIIRLRNLAGSSTSNATTEGYMRDIYDLGSLSGAGNWVVQATNDEDCSGGWWDPAPSVWQAVVIVKVT